MGYQAAFFNLGCRLNQAETALLTRRFAEHGYAIVEYPQDADLLVINSCSVTAHAEARCRNIVRSVLRRSPRTFVAVTGCYAQLEIEALKRIAGIDLIVGNQHKMELPRFVDGLEKLPRPVVVHTAKIPGEGFSLEGVGYYPYLTRANLKIQDGCDAFCTFCVIPWSRGRERSRCLADIEREARALVQEGHQEIVLTGANLGRYGEDGKTLVDVVRILEGIEGLRRIRLTSMEPTTLSLELIEYMAASEKLCHYFHLPLQSGDDRILQAMNRQYRVAQYVDLIEEVVRRIPDVGLGSDIIVGFPGEGEEEFERTRHLVEELPFAYLHVFSYSPRRGTRALRLPGRVGSAAIKERSAILRQLSAAKRQAFYAGYVDRTVEVLFETRDQDGYVPGFTQNYMRVGIITPKDLANQLRQVRITGLAGEMAIGHLRGAPQ